MDRLAADPTADAALLTRIAQGDRNAFEALFAAYERPLYRYVLGLVSDPHAAEEVTSDVLLDVWRSAARFRGDGKPSTWIFGIAHHKAIDHLRRKRPNVVELRAAQHLGDEGLGPGEAVLTDWSSAELAAALERLSYEHRAVIALAFVHGYGQREIAQIMDCPLGTVKTRMFHAKAQLRKLLAQPTLQREIS